MAKQYRFSHRYKSGIGHWEKDAVAELSDAEAAFIQVDSPGAITRVKKNGQPLGEKPQEPQDPPVLPDPPTPPSTDGSQEGGPNEGGA